MHQFLIKKKHLLLIKVMIGARVCNSMIRERLEPPVNGIFMFLGHKPINLSMPDMFNRVDD